MCKILLRHIIALLYHVKVYLSTHFFSIGAIFLFSKRAYAFPRVRLSKRFSSKRGRRGAAFFIVTFIKVPAPAGAVFLCEVVFMEPRAFTVRASLPPYLALPMGGAGAVLLVLSSLRCLGLSQGAAGARVFVLCCLLGLALLSMAVLARPEIHWSLLCPALAAVGLAFFLRAVSLDHQTQDYQLFLAKWAEFFRDNGGFAAIREPVGNYNVPYLYFLAAISYLPVPDLYCIKLFSVLFDVLLAWGGMRLVRHFVKESSLAPPAAFLLLLALPTVILNGAYWAQCDVIYGAFVLHALASALDKRGAASVVLLAAAFSFKLQTVFLIPLWCALWFTGRVKFRHLLLFPAAYFGTILPALLLGKPLPDILSVYVGQTTEYASRLTLNAPSWYQFIPYGAEVDNGPLFIAGIVAAFALVLGLLAVLFLFRARVDDRALMTAAVILAVGVPFLLPSMHDRYFFLADVLTVAYACISFRRAHMAALVQVGSLGAYYTYLTLTFPFIIRLFGKTWVMGLEALCMLAVLVMACFILAGELGFRPSFRARRSSGGK